MNRLRELEERLSSIQALQITLENRMYEVNKKKTETTFNTPIKNTNPFEDESRRTFFPSE